MARLEQFHRQAGRLHQKINNDGLNLTHAIPIDALRRETDEAVHLRAAERLRVVNRKANAVLELACPIGQTGNASLAGVPVPGGQVMEHLGQPVLMSASASCSFRNG